MDVRAPRDQPIAPSVEAREGSPELTPDIEPTGPLAPAPPRGRYALSPINAQANAGQLGEVDGLPDVRSLRIPMRPGLRSINVAIAAALILGEAMRQTDAFASLT